MANSKIIKFKDKKGNCYPYLFIDELTGIFYVKKRIGEDAKLGSLETKDFVKARSMILEKLTEFQTEKPGQKLNKIFRDYYDLMMKQKIASDTKATTLNRIEIIWEKSLRPYFEYVLPEDLDQEMITEFITWHKRKRPGVQLINVFKYLGNILNVMIEAGDMIPIKKPKLELPKDEQKHHAKQKGRYITDAELEKILKHTDPVTRLQVLIACNTGMRKMEIGALELSRLKKVKDNFIVTLDTDDTKTGLARQVPIPSLLTPLIEKQIKKGAKYLFPMKSNPGRFMSSQLMDKGWFDAKKKAKIQGQMRFHDLRHTCASNMAKSGQNIAVAVTVLGMSLATFQRTYLKLNANDLMIAVEANSQRLRSEVYSE